MTRLAERVQSAKYSIAESAIASPYIYPEYSSWRAAEDDLLKALDKLGKAREKWLKLIEPGLSDPLLKKLAARKGLIPPSSNGTKKG